MKIQRYKKMKGCKLPVLSQYWYHMNEMGKNVMEIKFKRDVTEKNVMGFNVL